MYAHSSPFAPAPKHLCKPQCPSPPKKNRTQTHSPMDLHGHVRCDAMTIGHIRSRWASSAVSDYIQVVSHICVKPFHYRRANSIDSIPLRLVKIEFKAFGVHFKKRRTPAHPTADKTPAPQSTHSHPPKMEICITHLERAYRTASHHPHIYVVYNFRFLHVRQSESAVRLRSFALDGATLRHAPRTK